MTTLIGGYPLDGIMMDEGWQLPDSGEHVPRAAHGAQHLMLILHGNYIGAGRDDLLCETWNGHKLGCQCPWEVNSNELDPQPSRYPSRLWVNTVKISPLSNNPLWACSLAELEPRKDIRNFSLNSPT